MITIKSNITFNTFWKETFIYGIGNSMFILIPLVLTPFLTRNFTLSQYGTIDLIYTTVLIIALISNFNLDSALLSFYYDEKHPFVQYSYGF